MTTPFTPRLLVTLGDPAGVGPEVLVRVLLARAFPADAEIVVLGGAERLAALAERFRGSLDFNVCTALPGKREVGRLLCLHVDDDTSPRAIPGRPERLHHPFVRNSLDLACRLCVAGEADALVTNPITKDALTWGGRSYPGQTQFVAEYSCGYLGSRDDCRMFLAQEPVMAMVSEKLRTSLVTDHVPYRRVLELLTPERLEEVLRTTWEWGAFFNVPGPRIGLCGLNPHAGEGGLLGSEEREIMLPVVERLRGEGLNISDPLAGDTIFNRALKGAFDFVVGVFHDQGLGPLKAVSFGKAVNVTLGIPIIRTSVDHGTAYDIAAEYRAQSDSLIEALKLGASMAVHRNATTGT